MPGIFFSFFNAWHLFLLEAMKLEMPAGFNEWEEANDWRLEFPVAAEASLHPGLMGQIIQRTLNGHLPENAAGFVLLRYQTENHRPSEQLETLLKTNLNPEQRQLVKRLIAVLKGEMVTEPPSKGNAEVPASKMTTVVELPAAKKAESKSTVQTASLPDEEPASSTPWIILVLLIILTTGLVWSLVKKK